MDVSFEPNARNDETHTNGISGKFTIKQEDQECIVHYMIAHLGSRAEALCSLLRCSVINTGSALMWTGSPA